MPAFAVDMLITVFITSAVWLVATYLTAPEAPEVLDRFFTKARPAGPGWKEVRTRLGTKAPVTDNLAYSILDWIAGVVMIYCSLFGIGHLILGQVGLGLLLLVLALLAGGFIYWDLRRRGFQTIAE